MTILTRPRHQPEGRRKAFGQHFLQDDKIISGILDAFQRQFAKDRPESVIEVGPGGGALTHPLLTALTTLEPKLTREHVLLIEKDRNIAAEWMKEERVSVLAQDFLKIPKESLLALPKPRAVISNLPYSTGTAILQVLAANPADFAFLLLMFQAEVAERLRAKPNTHAYSSLSVWIQNEWNVTHVLKVPPKAFFPPPKVDSEVVMLTPRAEPLVVGSRGDSEFERLVRLAFTHRRKMLRASLPKGGPAHQALLASGIDPTRRAETLTFDDWNTWFRALKNLNTPQPV